MKKNIINLKINLKYLIAFNFYPSAKITGKYIWYSFRNKLLKNYTNRKNTA